MSYPVEVSEYISEVTDVTEFLNLIYDVNPELLRAISLEMAREMPETLANYYAMKPLDNAA